MQNQYIYVERCRVTNLQCKVMFKGAVIGRLFYRTEEQLLKKVPLGQVFVMWYFDGKSVNRKLNTDKREALWESYLEAKQ